MMDTARRLVTVLVAVLTITSCRQRFDEPKYYTSTENKSEMKADKKPVPHVSTTLDAVTTSNSLLNSSNSVDGVKKSPGNFELKISEKLSNSDRKITEEETSNTWNSSLPDAGYKSEDVDYSFETYMTTAENPIESPVSNTTDIEKKAIGKSWDDSGNITGKKSGKMDDNKDKGLVKNILNYFVTGNDSVPDGDSIPDTDTGSETAIEDAYSVDTGVTTSTPDNNENKFHKHDNSVTVATPEISQPLLCDIEPYKELTFSGLTYRFVTDWEHWYEKNKVIYQRKEDNGHMSLFSIEVMDTGKSRLTYSERGAMAKDVASRLEKYGYTLIKDRTDDEILVLGALGQIVEGNFLYKDVTGAANIFIFTYKDRIYILTAISSSSSMEDVRTFAEKIMDSVIRLN